jgi:hypothetical protein
MLEGQPAALAYLIQLAEYQLPMLEAVVAVDAGPALRFMEVLVVLVVVVLVDSQLIRAEQLQDNQELTVLVVAVVVVQLELEADLCPVGTAAME